MNARLITPPAFEPVTLAEARAQCRIDTANTLSDALLEDVLIPGAREDCEQRLRRAIVSQGWRLTLDRFPLGAIALPWPRLLAVTAIRYRDSAGTVVTLAGSAYEADTEAQPGTVQPIKSTTWPSTYGMSGDVQVDFTAGYSAGDRASQLALIPKCLKQWILLRVATAFEFREDVVAGASVAQLPNRFADSLLDREKVYA